MALGRATAKSGGALAFGLAVLVGLAAPLSPAPAQSRTAPKAEPEGEDVSPPARARLGQRLAGPTTRKLDSRLDTRLETRVGQPLNRAVNRGDDGAPRGRGRKSRRCGFTC